MKLKVVQPGVPKYRQGLFSRLSEAIGTDFAVYSSQTEELGILVDSSDKFDWQKKLGPIQKLPAGLEWQQGALSIPMSKNDVLVVSGNPRSLSTLALVILARLRGVRTMWWGHFWSSSSKSWRAQIRYVLMRFCHGAMFYTDQEVKEYSNLQKDQLPMPVFALNNGVETREIIALRKNYTAATRDRDFLFIGRLTQKAQMDLALKALASLEAKTITLDVVGDGEALDALKHQANLLQISERIRWHGAIVDESEIAAIANRCKAFVYPGSVGLSLIHGMAYGLPAVVHNDRWKHMPEIAAHCDGETGVSFASDDKRSLANAMNLLIRDQRELERMSRNAVDITRHSYNTEDMTRRFLFACQSIANV